MQWFSYHNRMPFKIDILAVMKRIGQVPSETLEDNIKQIEESRKTKKELEQLQDANTSLTQELDETKSYLTSMTKENDQMKVENDQMKVKNESQGELLKAKDEQIALEKEISKQKEKLAADKTAENSQIKLKNEELL